MTLIYLVAFWKIMVNFVIKVNLRKFHISSLQQKNM